MRRTRTCASLVKAPPSPLFSSTLSSLHHSAESSQSARILLSTGHRHSAAQHCTGGRGSSAAHRLPRSGAGGEQRRRRRRRRKRRKRTRSLSPPTGGIVIVCSIPSLPSCLWGVKDSLGLLDRSPCFCSAPTGQVEKVSDTLRCS